MNAQLIAILAPISTETPCGEDLSFSSEFDRIHEARREDDSTVDYGEWQAPLKQADWPLVVECCTELLLKRSKDLRLAAWLTEGLVKTLGLAGLANGLEITARLIAHYGPLIHPLPEGGDQEQRIGTLSWFVLRTSQLVRQIPFTDAGALQYTLNDYDAACAWHAHVQRHPESIAEGPNKITLEKIASGISKTDQANYQQWMREVERCRSALDELRTASASLLGEEGPSFSALQEALEALYQRLQAVAAEFGTLVAVVPQHMVDNRTGTIKSHAGTAFNNRAVGPINDRAQALEVLRQVAAFFRETEPHSPVAYLADKAAHWGDMPLHSWLRSVVKDRGTLSHIEELLGLEMDSEER